MENTVPWDTEKTTNFRWRFNESHEDRIDNARSRRRFTSRDNKNIGLGRRMTVRTIADKLKIEKLFVQKILTQELRLRKCDRIY